MKLYICPYKLIPKDKQLNSTTYADVKYGSLIKCEYENKKIGYADFHNGENFLNDSLFDLKKYFNNIKGPQWEQSLYMAQLMSKVVSTKDKSKLTKVKSHYLIQNINKFKPLDLLKLEVKGYSRFKVKMGIKLKSETNLLKALIQKSAHNTLFRLDFNASIEKKEFMIWLEKNKDSILNKVEFIEDPISFAPGIWQHIERKFDVNLALDQAEDPIRVDSQDLPTVIVLKPAVQNVKAIIDKHKACEVRFVFTHYMDHPVGQLGANFLAQTYKNQLGELMLDGGLMGFDMFEKNIFSQIRFSDQTSVPVKVFTKKSWGLDFILKDLKWLAIN